MALVPVGGLFAVLAQDSIETIGTAIKVKYPHNHYSLVPGQWLIVSPGETTKGLSDGLGITDGSTGSAVVLACTSYFGRANPQVWEWINSKMAAPHG